MAASINAVVIVGNLTRDPELRHTPSGMPVCSLRVAVNDRVKDNASGDWMDKPYFFNVTVWGNQGESCAQYLAKGRRVGVHGKLTWREWEDSESGRKREAVEITARDVQFLSPRGEGDDRDSSYRGEDYTPAGAGSYTSTAGGDDDFRPTNDDIPF
jgi:single-strand DNA-binding protein